MAATGAAPTPDTPAECVADKSYLSRDVLQCTEGGSWKVRIAEPNSKDKARWRGDAEARRTAYNNRAPLRSTIGRQAMRRRGDVVERSFAHTLDRGGMRRAWLRGRENIRKRYLIHAASHSGSQCVIAPARERRERPRPANGQRFCSFRATTAPSSPFSATNTPASSSGYHAIQPRDAISTNIPKTKSLSSTRCYGWAAEWPSRPDEGYFRMLGYRWLTDERVVSADGAVAILIPVETVEMVEFVPPPNAKD